MINIVIIAAEVDKIRLKMTPLMPGYSLNGRQIIYVYVRRFFLLFHSLVILIIYI